MDCRQMAKRIEEEWPDEDVPYCHQDKIDGKRIEKYCCRTLRSHTEEND